MNEYIKVNLTGKLLRVAVSAINFSFNSISHTNTSLFPERYSYVFAKRFWFLIVSFFFFTRHVVQDPDMLRGGRLRLHTDLWYQ